MNPPVAAMNEGRPTVCVGMPVYNEGQFIAAAIESLLAQTDDTSGICRGYAEREPRIRYVRNEANIGAAANFARAFELCRGRYFLWAGGHDLWDRELVERSVAVLEERPEAVVALAECRWIGRDGQPVPRRSGHTDTGGMSAVERFFTVLWGNMHPILGLIRSEALQQTKGVQSCMGADLLLLGELALRGDFAFVPGTCWYRREIRPQETYSQMMQRHRSPQYRLASGIAARMPLLSLGARLLGTVWHAPLPLSARLAVCAGLAATMPARYVGARLRRQ
jgi:glycosyltransferase involved in cell wall biosynthesis